MDSLLIHHYRGPPSPLGKAIAEAFLIDQLSYAINYSLIVLKNRESCHIVCIADQSAFPLMGKVAGEA